MPYDITTPSEITDINPKMNDTGNFSCQIHVPAGNLESTLVSLNTFINDFDDFPSDNSILEKLLLRNENENEYVNEINIPSLVKAIEYIWNMFSLKDEKYVNHAMIQYLEEPDEDEENFSDPNHRFINPLLLS